MGRAILTTRGAIPWADKPGLEENEQASLTMFSALCSLSSDCGHMWPAASCPCHQDSPVMMD